MALTQRARRQALETRRIRLRRPRRDTAAEEEVKAGPRSQVGECHKRSVVSCAKCYREVASDEDGPAVRGATRDQAELFCGSSRGQSLMGGNEFQREPEATPLLRCAQPKRTETHAQEDLSQQNCPQPRACNAQNTGAPKCPLIVEQVVLVYPFSGAPGEMGRKDTQVTHSGEKTQNTLWSWTPHASPTQAKAPHSGRCWIQSPLGMRGNKGLKGGTEGVP